MRESAAAYFHRTIEYNLAKNNFIKKVRKSNKTKKDEERLKRKVSRLYKSKKNFKQKLQYKIINLANSKTHIHIQLTTIPSIQKLKQCQTKSTKSNTHKPNS